MRAFIGSLIYLFFNFNKPLTGMHSAFVFFVTIWHILGKQVHCSLEKYYPEDPFKKRCVFHLEKRCLNVFHSLALQFWCTVITTIAGKKVIFLIVLPCRPVSLGKYRSLLYRQLSYFRCRYIVKTFISDRLSWNAILFTQVRDSFYFPYTIKRIPYLPLLFVHL